MKLRDLASGVPALVLAACCLTGCSETSNEEAFKVDKTAKATPDPKAAGIKSYGDAAKYTSEKMREQNEAARAAKKKN